MRAVARMAHTEVLEHRRQPAMLAVMAVTYLCFFVLFAAAFIALEVVSGQPEVMAQLQAQLEAVGVELDAWLYLGASTFTAMMFTNMPLFVSLFAAYSVLHDRTCGTMPFLMLSPLTRWQLLAGKLAGVMVIPLVMHGVFVGVSTLILGRLDVLEAHAAMVGGSAAWWVAFALGIPMATVFIGALGTVISALSRDVRTSLQYTQFFIGFLSLGLSVVVVDMLKEGVVMQLVFAAAALVMGLIALLIGARLISRDVPPT